ncbi:TPA: Arc family DNA-binding protein [Salmonella enterica]
MSKYPSQMQDKFNLRFPDGMRDAVAERAKRNGRSMNSEIVQILGDALYGTNGPDDEFEKMFEYVTTEYPCDEDEWRVRDRMLTQLVFEITNRLERETARLKALFEIRAPDGFYTTPTASKTKPT